MKGRISLDGVLYIARGGREIKQRCLHLMNGNGRFDCEHDCPAFREPRVLAIEGKTTEINLRLCDEVGTLYFDELTDERTVQA